MRKDREQNEDKSTRVISYFNNDRIKSSRDYK